MDNTFKHLCLIFILILLPLGVVQAEECNGVTWAPTSRYKMKSSEAMDLNTGLSWKRCAEGMSWSRNTCTGKPSDISWDEALRRYPKKGKGWRLPTKDELATLLTGESDKSGCWSPAINTHVFPGKEQATWYWSSSPAGFSDHVWVVIFEEGGGVGTLNPGGNAAVRLVRDN